MFLSCTPTGLVYMSMQSGASRWVVDSGEYLRSAHGTFLTAHVDGRVYMDGKGEWGKVKPKRERERKKRPGNCSPSDQLHAHQRKPSIPDLNNPRPP